MADQINWNDVAEETHGEGAIEKTPWIKLQEDVPFEGVLTLVSPGKEKTGFDGKPMKYTEIWFDDEGMERSLDATLAIIKQFTQAAPQIGDTVRITKARELQVDKDGNPVMGQNPETGAEEQQTYTRYKVEVIKKASAAKTSAKKATKEEEAKDEEPSVDIAELFD